MYNVQSNVRSNLKKTELEKDLGVWFSSDGTWNDQTRSAISKANQRLRMIKTTFKYPDEFVIKKLYTSLVRPIIEYADSVWFPLTKQSMEELERNMTGHIHRFCSKILILKFNENSYKNAKYDSTSSQIE